MAAEAKKEAMLVSDSVSQSVLNLLLPQQVSSYRRRHSHSHRRRRRRRRRRHRQPYGM